MNPFIIGAILWMAAGIVLACCFVHGAAKVRRSQEAALAASPLPPYSAGYTEVCESPYSYVQTAA